MYAAFLNAVHDILNPPSTSSKIKNFFKRKKAEVAPPKPQSSDPLVQSLLYDQQCPDCKGKEFFDGPSGGMSQNVKCANRDCGSEFCIGPFLARRTNRSEKDAVALYGVGYGPKHPVPAP